MRDRDAIDAELRRLAAARRSTREHGRAPSTREFDALLDERLGHPPEAPETETVAATVVRPSRRKGVRLRFGLLAALPLSLVAVVAAVVAMYTFHSPPPTAQPPAEAPPAESPPSAARPNPAPPTAQPPPVDMVDKAFIDALRQEQVPIPSRDYVTSHGHAACDFLAKQQNFADAVHFVQESSVWDANQSAYVTAGAIVSYCPQYLSTTSGDLRQASQTPLPDLPNIQGDLEGIEGVLRGIRDDLQGITGQQ
ncbi:DUF732 domain-containing protein [Mycobacterium branderi]|uniref:DUF732 domain-containing protein n=1 Tax=Mycobacterium branderi TaxID=43348 RepID=A0A7I7WBE4_9MYCO|nr:DUF732 domain-containing protein [Mycobacterium branderi]MCV7234077.1 DUF732 domain-containing protein [Mycobacterium branderi]ORA32205.1 hypothetical protein BST20_25280 [Mycobacterium branderi]BBZ13841.1 hypothetical protein MBRA_40360 [Mycobacterium branderi]